MHSPFARDITKYAHYGTNVNINYIYWVYSFITFGHAVYLLHIRLPKICSVYLLMSAGFRVTFVLKGGGMSLSPYP